MEIQKLTAVSLGKKIKEKEISVREALDAVMPLRQRKKKSTVL